MVKITELKDRGELIGRLEEESLLEVIEHIVQIKSPIYFWIRYFGEEGHFYFREGKMVYAESRSLRAKQSAYHLLAFRGGIFRISRAGIPGTENVDISWTDFKNNFLEEINKLVLNFIPDLEGKLALCLTDFRFKEIFSHFEPGAKEIYDLLQKIFKAGLGANYKSLVRGVSEELVEEKGEVFVAVNYIPELRYFLALAGERGEKEIVLEWVKYQFVPKLKEAVSIALRRSDRLIRKAGVLAVIPEKVLSEEISSSLSSAGFKLWLCQDGFEALVRTEDYAPDVIILFSELARMSASEIYQRLKQKERSQHIPIICLVEPEKRKQAQSQRCGDLYLDLPFSGKKLVKLVENLLELK